MRRRLASAIWPLGFPVATPEVTLDYGGTSYATTAPADVDHVDLLLASLPRGGESRMHLLHPSAPELGRLVVVHGGHGISYYDAGTNMLGITAALLQAGYHVLGVCMPVDSFNETQAYALADGTPVTISNHNFAALESDGVHPLEFFLNGTLQGINYVRSVLELASIDMTGLSGGGWTTDFIAGIDPRIRRSYPVFGSMPYSLISPDGPGDPGDWEQAEARSWWTILGDKEALYTLGCVDKGRRRVQFLGNADPVFPASTVHDEIEAYAALIDSRVPTGQHEVRIDTTADAHEYSAETIAAILEDLAA